jgi:type I restriction-modification system DNA methylase subunit
MDYSNLSKELTAKLSKVVKQKEGIYFTPPSCVNHTLQLLQPYMDKIVTVLEPSCGSGEYINALRKFPHLKITGIELNQTIYQSLPDKESILNMNYLDHNPDTLYDLIIGNPPYYVMKLDKDVKKKYHSYFEGRPNIFILFIIQSLKLLKADGILSFVLPTNFLNCLYYDKTRKYIKDHFQILHLLDCKDRYLETQQDTILLILQKTFKINNTNFMLEKEPYTIFVTKRNELIKLYENSKSLSELGFKVNVGTVVWNQCKDILTDDDTKTRLIYSSDIVSNTLAIKKYSNDEKKNFIEKVGIKRPMIVINRGYGMGEYKFNYCLLDEQKEYLIENHLICIESKNQLPHDLLIMEYEKIIASLKDKRTLEFVKNYFGNNAINTIELNHILPIYQDI